jgi:hypothetical protein
MFRPRSLIYLYINLESTTSKVILDRPQQLTFKMKLNGLLRTTRCTEPAPQALLFVYHDMLCFDGDRIDRTAFDA